MEDSQQYLIKISNTDDNKICNSLLCVKVDKPITDWKGIHKLDSQLRPIYETMFEMYYANDLSDNPDKELYKNDWFPFETTLILPFLEQKIFKSLSISNFEWNLDKFNKKNNASIFDNDNIHLVGYKRYVSKSDSDRNYTLDNIYLESTSLLCNQSIGKVSDFIPYDNTGRYFKTTHNAFDVRMNDDNTKQPEIRLSNSFFNQFNKGFIENFMINRRLTDKESYIEDKEKLLELSNLKIENRVASGLLNTQEPEFTEKLFHRFRSMDLSYIFNYVYPDNFLNKSSYGAYNILNSLFDKFLKNKMNRKSPMHIFGVGVNNRLESMDEDSLEKSSSNLIIKSSLSFDILNRRGVSLNRFYLDMLQNKIYEMQNGGEPVELTYIYVYEQDYYDNYDFTKFNYTGSKIVPVLTSQVDELISTIKNEFPLAEITTSQYMFNIELQ